ncbi:MAG: GntR family transcriptional regulator [Azospirillaceae bacterium]
MTAPPPPPPEDAASGTAAGDRDPARAGAPRYLRLARDLADRIAQGEFKPGDALPPERRIAQLYDVSRVTVRRALEHLASDGVVEARHGSGTYVSRRVRQPLRVLTGFSEDVRARGMLPSSVVLDRGVGTATPEEAIGLGLSPGERVTRIKRLRLADGAALAIESTAIVHDALPDPDAIGESLYETLQAAGNRPVRAIQRLTAVALDDRTAPVLEAAPGSPGLHIVRVGYRADGRPIEYTWSYYRGDRWDFVTELVEP